MAKIKNESEKTSNEIQM